MSEAATPRPRRERPGPLEYLRRWPLRIMVGGTLFFLYLPLITLMVFSFNDSRRNIVWEGFTLKYYEKAFSNASLIEAFTNSLTIAFATTILSVILGALAAVMLWRFRFPGKTAAEGGMAHRTAVAVEPRRHHHRAHFLCFPLCRHGRARKARIIQPRA